MNFPNPTLPCRILLALLLPLFCALSLSAEEDWQQGGPIWRPESPCIAQIRMVPDPEVPHRAEIREWDGPEGSFGKFQLFLSARIHSRTRPKPFDFAAPHVAIQGESETVSGSYGSDTPLFDRPSTVHDIEYSFARPSKRIEPGKEYLAGEIYGRDAMTRWKIYVRFLKEVPEKSSEVTKP